MHPDGAYEFQYSKKEKLGEFKTALEIIDSRPINVNTRLFFLPTYDHARPDQNIFVIADNFWLIKDETIERNIGNNDSYTIIQTRTFMPSDQSITGSSPREIFEHLSMRGLTTISEVDVENPDSIFPDALRYTSPDLKVWINIEWVEFEGAPNPAFTYLKVDKKTEGYNIEVSAPDRINIVEFGPVRGIKEDVVACKILLPNLDVLHLEFDLPLMIRSAEFRSSL